MSTLFEPRPSVFERPSGLPDLPPLTRPDPPIHWLGDDGKNVFLEIQGQIACVAFANGPLPYEREKRKEISGFSPASRLRLFKVVNRLEWQRAGKCTFATVTFPDSLGRPEPKEITLARSLLHRGWERACGRKVAGLWRVEWEVRKSGRFLGQFMPHVHTIYFNVPFVPQKQFQEIWQSSLRTNVKVRVDLRKIKNVRMMLYYVSKYVAKIDGSSSLVIPSYLSKYLGGRKWGYYRRELMPYAPKFETRMAPCALVDKIRKIATEAYANTPALPDQGFTVFGPAAEQIKRLVAEHMLTTDGELLS